jgi:hypothetical protein
MGCVAFLFVERLLFDARALGPLRGNARSQASPHSRHSTTPLLLRLLKLLELLEFLELLHSLVLPLRRKPFPQFFDLGFVECTDLLALQ